MCIMVILLYNAHNMEFDMKKKLIIAIAIVLLLAISTTMLVGCDEIIKKNEERDAMQVVATVNYGDKTAYVYKYELETVFNNYAYAYVNYYGMSYEEAANYLVQSLAQQRLLNLFALEKVAELKGVPTPGKAEDLLSASEKKKAIDDANDSMLSSLVSIVEDLITEDNANTVTTTTKKDDTDTDTAETDSVYVRFETNGADAIAKIKVTKGTKATAPDEPTRTGYTFYGWYQEADFSGEEFDFETTTVSGEMTLYAKWEKHLDARTERPEVEEEDDYDPEDNTAELPAKFFSAEYQNGLFDDTDAESVFTKSFLEAEFASDIAFDENETTLVEVLKEYISEGLADFKKELMANLYKDSVDECYEYYLNSQMQSLLLERLQRMLGDQVTVTDAEIAAEFEAALAKNKETFADGGSSYESALESALSTTYYHPTKNYGFVLNILLKLDDESMEILTDMAKENPDNASAIIIKRNELIANMEINVSNPNYDADATIEDANGNVIEVRDADTDSRNPYNKVGKTTENPYDASYEYKTGDDTYANDYSQIVSFEKVDGEYQIVFKATQHPSMAYLIDTVPAFDKDGKVGIIHQIYNSFEQVKNASDLTKEQQTYWLREVATTWLYIVGDDTGALSSDSNNGGLGYLVTPEGESSNFIADFTDYARTLVAHGTGSYAVESSEFTATDGNFVGNKKTYVVADSMITKDGDEYVLSSTSNAYAGVFVLLNSYSVWDANNIKTGSSDALDNEGSVLPYDYIITFAKDQDDVKTIKDTIYDSLKDSKSTYAYNSTVTAMNNQYGDSISYNDKVIKSLWKDLD